MSDKPHDPPSPTDTGGTLVRISERLIRVLPPAFLLLIVMNCLFLGAITWQYDHNAEARNVLLTKIVERCLIAPPRP
jgi:hypothetical protein